MGKLLSLKNKVLLKCIFQFLLQYFVYSMSSQAITVEDENKAPSPVGQELSRDPTPEATTDSYMDYLRLEATTPDKIGSYIHLRRYEKISRKIILNDVTYWYYVKVLSSPYN